MDTPIEKLASLFHSQIENSINPPLAESSLSRFLERSLSPQALVQLWKNEPSQLDQLLRLLCISRFLSQVLFEHPEYYLWLISPGAFNQPLNIPQLIAERNATLGKAKDIPAKLRLLHRWQKRELLHIATRDLWGHANLETTTNDLSRLTDFLIEPLAESVYDQLSLKYGKPQTTWCMFALGKWGGQELNYSSDIDVIFLYDEDGETADPPESGMKLTHHEFFNRWAGEFIKAVTTPLEGMGLYRMDARLRPDGTAGPLARSLGSYLRYYEMRGQLWERQMLIKARRVAGDEKLAENFFKNIRPFIFPKSHLKNPLEEIAQMKWRIEEKDRDPNNVKTCAGGIRDVEFIVQALQILHGGLIPEICSSHTLTAIRALHNVDLLTTKEEHQLTKAYLFYRSIEHRLQLFEFQQTHTIPTLQSEKEEFAKRLGSGNPVEFETELKTHLVSIKEIFNQVFDIKTPAVKLPSGRGSISLSEKSSRVLKNLRHLLGKLGKEEESEKYFSVLEPYLFEAGLSFPDFEVFLLNLERLVNQYPSPAAFYQQLLNLSEYRHQIFTLCGTASAIIDRIVTHPEFIDLLSLEHSHRTETPLEEATQFDQVLHWREWQWIKIAIQDAYDHDFLQTQRNLSDTAEKVLLKIVSLLDQPELVKNLGMMALGKLGGREINYFSDLDLLFVYHPSAESDHKNFENFVSLLVERSIPVYELDLKLRPEGRSAILITSSDKLIEYLHHRVELWERLAFTRLRPIYGTENWMESILEKVKAWQKQFRWEGKHTRELLEMRKRLEQKGQFTLFNRRPGQPEIVDIKYGPGGMLDVEFLVEMLAVKNPAVPSEQLNMVNLLSWFSSNGTVEAADSNFFAEHYLKMRNIEKTLRLVFKHQSHRLPNDPAVIEALSKAFGENPPGKFINDLKEEMKECRRRFLRMIQ